MRVYLLFLFYLSPLFSTTSQWTGTTSGVWTDSSNWTPGNIPQSSGDVANLTNASPTNTTISLTGSISLGTLNLDLGSGYTINPGGGSLTFNTPSTTTAINVTTTNGNGGHTITSTVSITKALTVTQNSTAAMTISGVISGSSLTKEGSGVLILSSGNNSFSATTINNGTVSISVDKDLGTTGNAVTISNGILLYNTDISQSRPISLTGSAGLQAGSGVTAQVMGVISGDGSLTTGGIGTIELSAINLYKGGTTISTGTLEITKGDVNLGDSSGSLNFGNGTLNINTTALNSSRSGSITGNSIITSALSNTLSGNFSGAGSLTFEGGGTFTLIGINNYTGGTTVDSSTQLAGTTDGLQGNITLNAANSLLTFSQNFDGTYSGAISSLIANAGALTKLGTGTVTFTGSSPGFTGSTYISEGTLTINGSIANSSVTVPADGTLGGTGTVGPTTSSGTISPGSGSTIGTLSVNGNLVLNSGSHVELDIAPLSADAIAVNGSATITNASLNINPTSGFYGFSASYTILTSTALTPSFFPVTSSNSAFIPSVSYPGTSAVLNVVITKPFAVFPFSNSNTEAVGNNIDLLYSAGQLSQDMLNIFNTLVGQSFDTINHALDQMHPAPFSAFIEQQTEMGAQLLSILHRLPLLSCACYSPNRFWVEPFGNSLTVKSHGMEIGLQANSGGLALGYDTEIASNWIFGVAGAWNLTHLDWHDHYGEGTINGVYGAAYTDYQWDNFYIGAVLLSGIDLYDTNRDIQFLTTHRHAKANYHAIDVMAGIKSAYLFGSPQAFFYPYVNFDYLYFRTAKFTEKGAESLNLVVYDRGDGTLRTEMGLGLQVQDINADQTLCISPTVSLGWVNMCPIQRPGYKTHFIDTTIPFSVRGWEETWNLLNVNFGLSFTFYCFSLSMDYNVEMSPDSHTLFFNQHGNLQLDWKW